jgi:hypothetical protein
MFTIETKWTLEPNELNFHTLTFGTFDPNVLERIPLFINKVHIFSIDYKNAPYTLYPRI